MYAGYGAPPSGHRSRRPVLSPPPSFRRAPSYEQFPTDPRTTFENTAFGSNTFGNTTLDNTAFDSKTFGSTTLDDTAFDTTAFDSAGFCNTGFHDTTFDGTGFGNLVFDNTGFSTSPSRDHLRGSILGPPPSKRHLRRSILEAPPSPRRVTTNNSLLTNQPQDNSAGHTTLDRSILAPNITMSSTVETTPSAALSLRSHLLNLPQELFECVYNLTFTAEPGIRYLTRPPKGASKEGRKSRPLFIQPDHVGLLHVDGHSRRQFAESYFGGDRAVFICDITRAGHSSSSWLIPTLSSLDASHLGLIKDVRGVYAKCDVDDEEACLRRLCSEGVLTIRNELLVSFGLSELVKSQNEHDAVAELDGFQEFGVYGVELPPSGSTNRLYREARQEYVFT